MVRLHHPRHLAATRHLGGGRIRSHPRRLCVSCECVMSSDNPRKVCDPCRHRPQYDPRTDPAFPRLLADYLARHLGRDCDPCAHFAVVPATRYYVRRRIHDLCEAGWDVNALSPPRGGYHVATIPGRWRG